MRRRATLVAAATLAGAARAGARQRFRRRPVRYLLRRRPETAGAASPRAGELLCRSVRHQSTAAQPAPAPRVAGSGPAFCVRSCDGKYFPLTMRGNASPVQTCQAFCPRAPPRCFTAATSTARPRAMASAMPTAKTPSPIARRCAPIAPATAEARPGWRRSISRSTPRCAPATSIATTDGLVAYTGVRLGADQTAEFTPVASYPGLTADVRARLGEMKVAPVSAEMVAARRAAARARPRGRRCRRRRCRRRRRRSAKRAEANCDRRTSQYRSAA